MAPWLRVFEAWAVQQLLRTPAFHRAVEKVVKNVHRVRHGIPPEEMGGTKIDQQGPTFARHFVDELKTQLGRAEKEQGRLPERASAPKAATSPDKAKSEGADAAWQELQRNPVEPQKQGFMAEYMDSLREQIGQRKPPR